MVSQVAAAVVSTLASKAVDSIFGGAKQKSQASPAPQAAEPAVAPVRDDEASRRAQRQSIQKARSRSGRASTVLSDVGNGTTLG